MELEDEKYTWPRTQVYHTFMPFRYERQKNGFLYNCVFDRRCGPIRAGAKYPKIAVSKLGDYWLIKLYKRGQHCRPMFVMRLLPVLEYLDNIPDFINDSENEPQTLNLYRSDGGCGVPDPYKVYQL